MGPFWCSTGRGLGVKGELDGTVMVRARRRRRARSVLAGHGGCATGVRWRA